MKTKIVYVLTSSDNDFYLEQTLLSVYSLRIYNKEAKVILITDKVTNSTFVGTRRSLLAYFDEIIVVETPQNFNNVRKSRFLKTKVRDIISGDFLFVDSDTIITQSLESIDDIDIEIGGVPDKHVKIDDHPLKDTIVKQVQRTGLLIDKSLPYINSGVFFVKDTPLTHELYKHWHTKWMELQPVQTLDQPPLAWVNHEMGYPIKLLPDFWNCQVIDGGLKFLNQSFIIHYFASSKNSNGQTPYAIYNTAIYDKIKKTGKVDDEVDRLVRNPLSAFIPVCRIIAGDDMKILDGNFYKQVYKQYPLLFSLVEKLSLLCVKVFRRVKLDNILK